MGQKGEGSRDREGGMASQGSDAVKRGGVAGAVALVGIGMLALDGWWWPGLVLVGGCALAAERFVRGDTAQAAGASALFLAILIAVALVQGADVPWDLVAAFALVASGLAAIVRGAAGP